MQTIIAVQLIRACQPAITGQGAAHKQQEHSGTPWPTRDAPFGACRPATPLGRSVTITPHQATTLITVGQ
jgi:hypothetical protein